jgi:hypothetical protein
MKKSSLRYGGGHAEFVEQVGVAVGRSVETASCISELSNSGVISTILPNQRL